MAKQKAVSKHTPLVKRTSQGGSKPKRSSMSKNQKRNVKAYRGQGR